MGLRQWDEKKPRMTQPRGKSEAEPSLEPECRPLGEAGPLCGLLGWQASRLGSLQEGQSAWGGGKVEGTPPDLR